MKGFLEAVGNTPMVQIDLPVKATVFAKLEYLNPGGSVKDRSALFMVQDAERNGFLKPGGTIVEASSGNQGIALSMIGAMRGYRVVITVPTRTSPEKVGAMRAYGAEVVVCADTGAGGESYADVARRLAKEIPGAHMPNQYVNNANVMAHYTTTGPEIWRQTEGKITHFFASAGSCGTIVGVGKYLKEQNAKVTIVGADAATSAYSSKEPKPYMNEGIGIDHPEALFDKNIVDVVVPTTDDEAFSRTRALAQAGMLVGPSSGAVVEALVKYAPKLKKTDIVVVIFADSGRAYLSKVFATAGAVTGARKTVIGGCDEVSKVSVER